MREAPQETRIGVAALRKMMREDAPRAKVAHSMEECGMELAAAGRKGLAMGYLASAMDLTRAERESQRENGLADAKRSAAEDLSL